MATSSTSDDHRKEEERTPPKPTLPASVDHKEEESSEDAHIYLRAQTSDGSCQWYVINNSEDTRHKSLDELQFLTPVFDDHNDMEYKEYSACVPLGSVLYVIGGYRTRPYSPPIDWCLDAEDSPPIPTTTNEVYCIDTLRPETGWTRVCPLLQPRCNAHTFTLEGKIYVMGGFDSPLNYTEKVFDPSERGKKNSRWESVFCDVPEVMANGNCFLHQLTVTERQSQLLVCCERSLYSYDFDDQSWNLCYDGEFGPSRFKSAILLDDIMYCYEGFTPGEPGYSEWGTIMGFDVKNPNMRPKIVRGLEEEKDFLPKPDYHGHLPLGYFRHLGHARLCLVLKEYIGNNRQVIMITCLKFTVSEVWNSSGEVVDLVASHLCKSSCCLDATSINNCFAM